MSKKNTKTNNAVIKNSMKTLNRLSIVDCILGTLFLIGAYIVASGGEFMYALLLIIMSAVFLSLAAMYRYRYKKMKDRNL